MKALAAWLMMFPLAAMAAPQILIDAVPSGVTLLGVSHLDAPSGDMEGIKNGLPFVVDRLAAEAAKRGADYVCVLSTPGADAVDVPLSGTSKVLHTSLHGPLVLVFYRRGLATDPDKTDVTYTTEAPDPAIKASSVTLTKVSLPPGFPTTDWIYLNLPRIQQTALGQGAHKVFFGISGSGAVSQIRLPGIASTVPVPEEGTVLKASWYVPAGVEAFSITP